MLPVGVKEGALAHARGLSVAGTATLGQPRLVPAPTRCLSFPGAPTAAFPPGPAAPRSLSSPTHTAAPRTLPFPADPAPHTLPFPADPAALRTISFRELPGATASATGRPSGAIGLELAAALAGAYPMRVVVAPGGDPHPPHAAPLTTPHTDPSPVARAGASPVLGSRTLASLAISEDARPLPSSSSPPIPLPPCYCPTSSSRSSSPTSSPSPSSPSSSPTSSPSPSSRSSSSRSSSSRSSRRPRSTFDSDHTFDSDDTTDATEGSDSQESDGECVEEGVYGEGEVKGLRLGAGRQGQRHERQVGCVWGPLRVEQ